MKNDVLPADAVIPLPEAFLERMEKMLGEEYPAFLAEYEDPAHSAFRLNPLKVAEPEKFAASLDFALERVPWEKNAWYYDAAVSRPGKSALHEAGAYYIQEPSAAAVVPSARSTSVCPAPGSVCGGKTTRQRPSGPAAARSVRASSATSTSAPGAAVPQTGSGQSRWRTA